MFNRRTKFNVAQLGRLDRAQVWNAVGLAGLTQGAFEFIFLPDVIDVPNEVRLANGGYDLDKVVAELIDRRVLPAPLILFTSLPYGDPANPDTPEDFYMSEKYSHDTFLISTYWWDTLRHSEGLQPYVLMMLSTTALSHLTHLQYHYESARCQFDYCDDVEDMPRVLEGQAYAGRVII